MKQVSNRLNINRKEREECTMNKEEIEIVERILKAQEKLVKVITQIKKLPDAQRKKLEAMNIIGPKFDKKMDVLLKDHKETKKWFEKENKEPVKSVDEGKSVEEILARTIG
jgi:hypothetical protein